MQDKLMPLEFAGATVNILFESWVKKNYPDIHDEWLLEASEWVELEEFLERHCAIDVLGAFDDLRKVALKEGRELYAVIEDCEAEETSRYNRELEAT